MLLGVYLKLTMTPAEFHACCGIPQEALPGAAQVRSVLGSLGLLTDLRTGLSLQMLFDTLAAGKPLVTLIRYRVLSAAGLTEQPFNGLHFGVAVGMDSRNIYLHDPLYTDPAAGEAHAYPLDVFLLAWKEGASDPTLPSQVCGAIIPTAGIGFRMTRRLRITAPALHVRSTPVPNGKVVATLGLNEVVEIQREMGGWGEIRENQWISLAYTAQVPG
jgi:hypothetical protein